MEIQSSHLLLTVAIFHVKKFNTCRDNVAICVLFKMSGQRKNCFLASKISGSVF